MKKRISKIAAAVCIFMTAGLLGCGTDEANTEKRFVDLPGAGVYIDQNQDTFYEVQIEPPFMEKDGVKVELKNFYATERRFYGDVFLTGNLLEISTEEDKTVDSLTILDEKYEITWYFGDEQRKMIDGDQGCHGAHPAEGVTVYDEFHTECEEYLYLEDRGIDTYYLQVKGFDEKFTLKAVEPKRFASLDMWGYSQAWNGNTIAAKASLAEDGILLEYYRDLTQETGPLYEGNGNFEYVVIPNHYELQEPRRVLNKDGQELHIVKVEEKINGNALLVNGTAEDFPLEFYYSGFSGTSGEEYTISLSVPEVGVKQTENLPKAEFEYGTVEILSVERDGRLKFTYDITAKEGSRQMYGVQMKQVKAEEEIHLGGGISWGLDGKVLRGEVDVYLDDLQKSAVDVVLYHPSHWIEGEYNIIIEKPTEG